MERIKNIVFALMSAAGSIIANQLGGWDTALAVLLAFMAADYITGLLIAIVWRKSPKTLSGGVSSAEGFKGLLKKMVILIFVWMAEMLDRVLALNYARTAVILFYIANEGLSIVENTAIMGVPYPKFIKRALEALKESNDDEPPKKGR
ncbi:MAG: phage holin family protein [Bacteroidales bacterium]|nr:phage holin family protein [Bacteroidales bacterium]